MWLSTGVVWCFVRLLVLVFFLSFVLFRGVGRQARSAPLCPNSSPDGRRSWPALPRSAPVSPTEQGLLSHARRGPHAAPARGARAAAVSLRAETLTVLAFPVHWGRPGG